MNAPVTRNRSDRPPVTPTPGRVTVRPADARRITPRRAGRSAVLAVLAVLAILLLTGWSVRPAMAGGGHGGSGGPLIEAGTPSPETIGVSVHAGGRRAVASGCSWRLVPVDTDRGRVPADPEFIASHRLYDRHDCDDPSRNTYVWVPIADVATVLIPALSAYMTARLPRPEPTLTPLRPDGWAIVQLPLDFRTSLRSWRPVVASASIDGPDPAYVTATARPIGLEFLPGDPWRPGDGVRCSGQGPTAPYDPARPGPCSYRYRNASSTMADRQTFDTRLRIHWEVAYRSSRGPGVIPIEPTETARSLAVAEVKALLACAGPSC